MPDLLKGIRAKGTKYFQHNALSIFILVHVQLCGSRYNCRLIRHCAIPFIRLLHENKVSQDLRPEIEMLEKIFSSILDIKYTITVAIFFQNNTKDRKKFSIYVAAKSSRNIKCNNSAATLLQEY